MIHLLDVNVLVALVVKEHTFHNSAEVWFNQLNEGFATCPITEGGLIRLLMREGNDSRTAREVLTTISSIPGYEFWGDHLSYRHVNLKGVIGHRQVTDAYLAQLARSKKGTIATFDKGLVHLHKDVAIEIPRI